MTLARRARPRAVRSMSDRGAVAAALAVTLLVAGGCGTARITRLKTHPRIEAYPAHASNDVLAVGVQVEERPGDARFWLNSPYRDRDLLVLSAKLRNTGEDSLLVRRSDLVIATSSGRKLVPLPPLEAVNHVKGALGLYRPLSLGTIQDGYELYALPDVVRLDPGEEVAGYLYFDVSERQWAEAVNGRLSVAFVRIEVVGEADYDLKLAR